MAVTVSSLIDNVLTDINENTDGSGKVPRADVLRYLQEAERVFNNITLILKTNAKIQAVADQVEYDLPDNFKAYLFNIEYDYKALLKQSKEFFDLYDENWRDPSNIASLSSIPEYYCTHMVELGKVLVWPPPSSSGESVSVRGTTGGVKQSITLDGTSYSLRGTTGGIKQSITYNSEVISLRGATGGLVQSIMPRKDNFYIEYIKKPDTLKLNGNIEPKLENYTDILEMYCKHKCYLRPSFKDFKTAESFLNLFNSQILIEKRNLDRAKSKNPVNFQPVYTTAQLGPKRAFVPY